MDPYVRMCYCLVGHKQKVLRDIKYVTWGLTSESGGWFWGWYISSTIEDFRKKYRGKWLNVDMGRFASFLKKHITFGV